jgi:hypothetical protein
VFEGKGEGAFAGSAEAGHPYGAAPLLEEPFACRAAYVSFVPGDII